MVRSTKVVEARQHILRLHSASYLISLPCRLQCTQLLLSSAVRSQMHLRHNSCHGNEQYKFLGVGSYDVDRRLA